MLPATPDCLHAIAALSKVRLRVELIGINYQPTSIESRRPDKQLLEQYGDTDSTGQSTDGRLVCDTRANGDPG